MKTLEARITHTLGCARIKMLDIAENDPTDIDKPGPVDGVFNILCDDDKMDAVFGNAVLSYAGNEEVMIHLVVTNIRL